MYSSHYLGKGKIQELFPSQIRNLDTALKCKVIDRTVLILHILAKRAKSKEAQLQVEIAKLQYILPRVTGLGGSLGRQEGSVRFISRGSGETKLELDHRKIKDKISRLAKNQGKKH